MKPTMAILERISKNSQENIDEVFTRLYRYLLRPDIYYVAYQNLYSNKGASTKGILDDTADGFSEEKIKVVEGEYSNIKMTTPEDLIFARGFLED